MKTTHVGTFGISSNFAAKALNVLKRCVSLCQIIDPFVEVEIIGLPVDCCKEQTRVVDDNGELTEKCTQLHL